MSAADVAALISSAVVTSGEVRRAVHHLPKPLRSALYDSSSPLQRSASGEFFEALVYEILLAEGEQSPAVVSIAAKMGDAEYVPFDKYSPDGLWYSRDGGIRFKVRGRVAAEIDFLVKTSDDIRVFGEVIVNPSGANGFSAEVAMKRALLERLYGGKAEFVLVMPVEAPAGGLRCLSEGDAAAVVREGDTLFSMVHPAEVLKRKLSPAASSKRVDGRVW